MSNYHWSATECAHLRTSALRERLALRESQCSAYRSNVTDVEKRMKAMRHAVDKKHNEQWRFVYTPERDTSLRAALAELYASTEYAQLLADLASERADQLCTLAECRRIRAELSARKHGGRP